MELLAALFNFLWMGVGCLFVILMLGALPWIAIPVLLLMWFARKK